MALTSSWCTPRRTGATRCATASRSPSMFLPNGSARPTSPRASPSGWAPRCGPPGPLGFVNERPRRLFPGDHVPPRITPNISVQRGDPASPLQSYLASLALTRDLDADVDEVLPAHEWRFRGLAERVDAIIAHHE